MTLMASAQVQVKGRVINLQNKPVSDVIVKLVKGSWPSPPRTCVVNTP